MAGMLPGVELARRISASHDKHRLGVYSPSRCSSPRIQSSNMDETALKARRNLERKLGSFNCSPKCELSKDRSTEHSSSPLIVGSGKSNSCAKKKERGHGSRLKRTNSEREVCAICLDVFKVSQRVMNLPCLHRYHSDCLIPRLSKHFHCPCCRTHVQF